MEAWDQVVDFLVPLFGGTANRSAVTPLAARPGTKRFTTLARGAYDTAQHSAQHGASLVPLTDGGAAADTHYEVPFLVSLYHKVQCAMKCGYDLWTGTGHGTPKVTAY